VFCSLFCILFFCSASITYQKSSFQKIKNRYWNNILALEELLNFVSCRSLIVEVLEDEVVEGLDEDLNICNETKVN